MNGGWLFGYIQALQKVNVETVFICFSKELAKRTAYVHEPTGTTIVVLPVSTSYKKIRERIPNLYTPNLMQAAGEFKGIKRLWLSSLLSMAPYASTPFFLLKKEIKAQRCNALLCQEYENPRFDICVAIGKMLKLPVYASFQGGNWQLSAIEKYLRKKFIQRSAGLVIAAKSEIERVTKKYDLPVSKICHCFNPVDVSQIDHCGRAAARNKLGLKDDLRIAIWHGRIDFHRKGLDLLLAAWEKLNKTYPGNIFRLILIGNGNNENELRQALLASSYTNITWIDKFINERKQIYEWLQAADVYVFPSRNEGFPVAPLEGMACGLPLIATDAPGIPDVLKDGEKSGGIIIRRDDQQSLVEQLYQFLDDRVYSERVGVHARRNIESNFSLKSVGEQLYQFIFK